MRHFYDIESVFMSGQSHLEVICGPMFSGKTEELIRRIRRVQFARRKVLVFKPSIDSRYVLDQVVSHSDHKIPSTPVSSVNEIRENLDAQAEPVEVVGLDEIHFFEPEIVALCEELVSKGMRVIAAGLCEDYLARPFGSMPELLAHADTITKLWAVCMRCGQPASKTQRVSRSGKKVKDEQILVGASLFYEARCRSCFIRGIAELSIEDSDVDTALIDTSV